MTNMKAAEKAAELANAAEGCADWRAVDFLPENASSDMTAFVQFIADADAAARIVSKVANSNNYADTAVRNALSPLILPDDVDPLVEAIKDCKLATLDCIEVDVAARLRAALAVRGLEIAEIFK